MMSRLVNRYAMALVVLMAPAVALAQEEGQRIEARLEGFSKGVRLPDSSNALTWMAFGFLCAICVAALFMNAKRSHLD